MTEQSFKELKSESNSVSSKIGTHYTVEWQEFAWDNETRALYS